MPSKYRVAVIGHTGKGNYGHNVDLGWTHLPECEIVGVADAHEGGLKKAMARLKTSNGFRDYRKLLDEARPDFVSICPRWLDAHRDMLLAAAERGIHVYMEKPFCRTLEEADEIVAACEKHKIKLAIAHTTRYSPRLQAVRDLIYDEKIGQILELRGRGKEDHRGGGEDLWVLGSHVMNLMHQFGGEASWCFATVTQDGHPIRKEDVQPGNEGIGPLAGDALQAMYGMQDGITGFFASRRRANGGGRRFGLQICGSKGIIEIGTGYLPYVYYLPDPSWSPGRTAKKWLPVSSVGVGKEEPYKDASHVAGNVVACRDLIAAVEEDRLPECNQYEARTTVEMIAAVFESHRLGRPASMPLKNRQNPLTLLGES